jgi:hypothetical protein
MQGVPLGAPFMIYRVRWSGRPSQTGPGHERRQNPLKALSTAQDSNASRCLVFCAVIFPFLLFCGQSYCGIKVNLIQWLTQNKSLLSLRLLVGVSFAED